MWQIPAARMKLRLQHKGDEGRDHLVPLPWQAIETLETIKGLTGRGPYVFPNGRSAHRPMSENALGYQPLAAPGAPTQRRNIGLGPCLVDEDEVRRVQARLLATPALAGGCNVRSILLGGPYAFF
ncbi:hypothetical protein [Enterovirga sp. CN4-39]|uniref:hypothetical protein n=1 Tax=Enterovirga sp. CN4-39 TaxID=3400910 RepID=UPI003C114DE6